MAKHYDYHAALARIADLEKEQMDIRERRAKIINAQAARIRVMEEALEIAERFLSCYRNRNMTGSPFTLPSDYDAISAVRTALGTSGPHDEDDPYPDRVMTDATGKPFYEP